MRSTAAARLTTLTAARERTRWPVATATTDCNRPRAATGSTAAAAMTA
jgi:hypothetical protein